jgi:hypothetical protein
MPRKPGAKKSHREEAGAALDRNRKTQPRRIESTKPHRAVLRRFPYVIVFRGYCTCPEGAGYRTSAPSNERSAAGACYYT